MNVRMGALLLAVTVTSGLANATTTTSRIDKRQANQQERIDQGVKSGELTRKEAARLQKGQQHVDRMESRAMADGKMTPRERQRIERAQDEQSKKIYREKHDRHGSNAQHGKHRGDDGDMRGGKHRGHDRDMHRGPHGEQRAGFGGKPSTERIDARQAHQQQRIDHGVKSGSLTEKEAARLQQGQQRVARMEKRAAADGRVTAEERRRIEHAQDRQSARIRSEAHDAQRK